MSSSFDQTAILIFSRSATDEAAVKTFDTTSGKNSNEKIAKRLIRATLTSAHRTRLPVFLHSSPARSNGTFGEKLADALESVYDKGYANVIVLGNDCPDINAELLMDARYRVENGKLVLGPCTDGGVYLIGINRADYYRHKFLTLAWESDQLQASWQTYPQFSAIEWLLLLSDIDQAADFKALLRRLPVWNPLRIQLLSILASSAGPQHLFQPIFHVAAPGSMVSLRGPPHY